MKYNLEDIASQKCSLIYLDSGELERVYHRRAYGFAWHIEGTDRYKIQTERIDLILNPSELQLCALVEVLKIIQELPVHDGGSTYLIYMTKSIEDHISNYGLESYNISFAKINLLKRRGVSIQLILNKQRTPALRNAINKAIEDYELTEAFRGNTKIITSSWSATFSEQVNDLVSNRFKDYRIVEYLGPNDKGIVMSAKYLVTPEDEASINPVLEQIQLPSHIWPISNTQLTSKLRRLTMTIRDADAIIMVTPTFGENDLLYPEELIYELSKFYENKIHIFDSESNQWFQRSNSPKRDLVQMKKKFTLGFYHTVALFSRAESAIKSWDNIKDIFVK
jgi:hypothetical protein